VLTFLSIKLTFLSIKLTFLSLKLTFLSLKLTFLSLKPVCVWDQRAGRANARQKQPPL
jgi:hypothetical protein